MTRSNAIDFTPGEIGVAVVFAFAIQVFFFVLLVAVGINRTQIKSQDVFNANELPIAVKPVLDDAPLLKLGGKKLKPKLPEMWKKHEPIPVQRFEEKSAPSDKAKDEPEAATTAPVATGDAEAPPPDAEVAKEVDETVAADAAVAEKEPDVEGPGAKDGVKEGTETDPLKARAVSQYRMKVLAWFNSRFKQPDIPCEELKKLSASISASVSSDGTVTGFSMGRSSGNATFDGRVKSTMDGIVGQQLPPPPPLYPEILGSSVQATFSGRAAKCD